ncbi:uncharacterized protein Triagg1_2906 [Trichoderma aggressivum f. europaeum]|uniref:Heterokaryon incompatibility domain-containing protein n=1 Tax=Trichoderma aggressivum f. europaeum TaxID=173218 RepID=A0AAE1IJT3_9HYPO|nr:hypothetical protein Triagg1_2906 [Trichoderma aggressivum f. europaeum]
MDHLPLPMDDFTHAPLEVPYLCNDRFRYDDHGFLTYPQRAGLDLEKIIERGLVDVDTLAPALQAWLWFGLVGEILGIGSRTHATQRIANYRVFVTENPEGSNVISTTILPRLIKKAGERNKSLRSDGFYSQRYYACLRVATNSINRLLSSEMCRKYLKWGHQSAHLPVLFRVILSIQILIESLQAAESVLLPESWHSLSPPTMECSSHELVDRLLIEAGWCQYEAGRLPGSIRLRYYLGFLHPRDSDPAQSSGRHLSCTRDACIQAPQSIHDQKMKPNHVTKDCKCCMETIRDLPLAELIKAGGNPLLRFAQVDGTARKLELLETNGKNKIPFVAISHVRHAGLGNDYAHSLPYCQLSRIQTVVDQIHPHSGDVTASTPFWLDTMCIPLDDRVHTTSLKRIREIFKYASRVLVIDQALCSHAIGSPEDALIQIRYSLWKRRLWTLQEGFVVSASNLIFCFANALFSLRDLVDRYEDKLAVPFPLLKSARFVGFRVLPHLQTTLDVLDDDIKRLAEMPQSLVGHLEKMKLRRILRLGYLASDDFMYFREDLETQQIQKLLSLLGDLYLDANNSPIVPGSRSVNEVASCCEALYRLDI